MKKLLLKLLIIIAIWVMGVQLNTYDLFILLEFFGFFIGMTFIPIIAIYVYRYKKKIQVKTLHKVFRFLVWLFIVMLTVYAIMTFLMSFYYSYYYALDWNDFREALLETLPAISLIVLLGLLLKVNTSLIPKNERTKIKLLTIIKQNKERVLVICTIIVVYIYGWYQWHRASEFDSFLWESGGYGDMMLDAISRQHFYELAFMKLAMFGGFVFGSLLLLMNVFKKKLF